MNSTINLHIDGFPDTAIAVTGGSVSGSFTGQEGEVPWHALQLNGIEIGATLFLSVEQLRKVVEVVDAYLVALPEEPAKPDIVLAVVDDKVAEFHVTSTAEPIASAGERYKFPPQQPDWFRS